MTIELDFSKFLRELREKLADPTPAIREVSRTLAEESLNLISEGFRTETDPYGQKWVPKQRPDGRMTLSGPTGRLKKYGAHDVDENGFMISALVEYALYHQRPMPKDDGSGQLKRPRRMQVPDVDFGLPPRWAAMYEEAALDVLEAWIGGGPSGGPTGAPSGSPDAPSGEGGEA